jgi:hypothetical protein
MGSGKSIRTRVFVTRQGKRFMDSNETASGLRMFTYSSQNVLFYSSCSLHKFALFKFIKKI